MPQFAGEFPKKTLDEALPHLRRPFTEHAVKFKIQSAWSKPDSKGAIVVTYIDARLVSERLNAVAGEAWEDDYREGRAPGSEECLLTILGVTRKDVGEASGIALQKALKSDALKRAAVKFGVGVSVYAVPVMMLNPADGLRPVKVSQKDSFALNDKGQKTCRDRYAKWLKEKGIPVFGEPFDHGDISDSQGDVEVEESFAAQEVERQEQAAGGDDRMLTAEEIQRIKEGVKTAGLDEQQESMLLGLCGVETYEELSHRSAFELYNELAKMTGKPPAKRQQTRRSS